MSSSVAYPKNACFLLTESNQMNSLASLFPQALIVWWATANFLVANKDEHYGIITALLFFLAIFLLSALFTTIALTIFQKQRRKILIFSYIVLFAMFLTPPVRELLDPFIRYRYTLLLMLTISVTLSLLLIRLVTNRNFILTISIFFLIMASMPSFQLLYFKMNKFFENSNQPAGVSLKGSAVIKPNVYYIVLDAYMRSDILKQNLGFDNSDFLNFMKIRGFINNDKSYASYPWTIFSLMSTFQMDYVQNYDTSIWAKRLESKTFKNFQALGYDRYFMAQSRGIVPCPTGVSCLGGEPKSDRFFIGRLGTTLIKTVPLLEDLLLYTVPDRFHYELNEISDLNEVLSSFEPKNPSFLYAHILMPHSPYTRDKNCNLVDFRGAGDFKSFRWEVRHKYLGFLECGNKQLKTLVETLVAKDPESIIILQGDHGAYFTYQKYTGDDGMPKPGDEPWREAAMDGAYSILNLMRVPKKCSNLPYREMGSINTFQMVFACLTQTRPDYLIDKTFSMDHEKKEINLIREKGRWLF